MIFLNVEGGSAKQRLDGAGIYGEQSATSAHHNPTKSKWQAGRLFANELPSMDAVGATLLGSQVSMRFPIWFAGGK